MNSKMRYAVVSLANSNGEQISRYLPGNYRIVGYAPHAYEPSEHTMANDVRFFGAALVIGGEDSHGWTLEDYVIPRLQSGLIQANEIRSDDPVLALLDAEDDRKRVTLVQSYRFPNVWSFKEDDHIWRDTMFANGVISSEGAIEYAKEQNWRIIEVVSEYWDEGPIDKRTGQRVDSTREIIAGHEYRQQRQIVEPLLYQPIQPSEVK